MASVRLVRNRRSNAVVSVVTGAVFGRKAVKAVMTRIAASDGGDSRTDVLQRRVALVNLAIAVILLSAVWAMVFKPTF